MNSFAALRNVVLLPKPVHARAGASDTGKDTKMRKQFFQLEIGERFHLGLAYGIGATKHVAQWTVWEKTSKTQARCIRSVGLNKKGWVEPFSGQAICWLDFELLPGY